MYDNVETSSRRAPAPRFTHAQVVGDFATGFDVSNPGDQDMGYLMRRRQIADITLSYVEGRPVPRVEYTDLENAVWGDVFDHVEPFDERIACQAYLDRRASLDFDRRKIQQLAEVNQKLAATTGFRMHPVLGFVTPRSFLNMLGHGTFLSTQYVRHHSIPEFTPEPDVIHELLGHGPALAKLAPVRRDNPIQHRLLGPMPFVLVFLSVLCMTVGYKHARALCACHAKRFSSRSANGFT